MGRFGLLLRVVPLTVLMATPAVAVETPAVPATPDVEAAPMIEEEWQDVITGQIEAFRARDAAGAFQFAAAPFQTAFPSAEAFFGTIIGSGYAPIMESTAHSFGDFAQLDDTHIAQEVMLTANDLTRFEAIYVLTKEEKGWRVSGVQLAKTPGISI